MVGGYQQGTQVLRQIRQAHAALTRDVTGTRDRLDDLERAARDGLQQRGQKLLELSRHYLPDINQETVANSFSEVRGELEEVLASKQQRETELRSRWEQTLDRRAELEEQLDTITEELDGLVSLRDELEQRLADILADDEQFESLSDQAVATEAELARNEARVAESRQEAAEKLPAYKNSRLFQYLVEQGYGTSKYKRHGLVRHLDKWVARLVDFHNANRSYDFLQVTPEMMAAEVDRRRAEFDGLMEQVEEIEKLHSDEIGLTDALERGLKAGKRRDALVASIESQERERDEVEQWINRLGSDQSEFYSQAVTKMKQFLESLQASALVDHARQTASRQDDALVSEVRQLGDEVDQARGDIADHRDALAYGQRRLADLSSLLRQYRSSEFDSPRSVFSDSYDAQADLSRFLEGKLSKQELWRSLRSAQRFAPQWVEQRWDHPSGAMDNDFSYVLMRVLAEAAGAAIEQSSQRGWRTRGGRVGGPAAPRRRRRSAPPPSVRRRARGGFTNGRGF